MPSPRPKYDNLADVLKRVRTLPLRDEDLDFSKTEKEPFSWRENLVYVFAVSLAIAIMVSGVYFLSLAFCRLYQAL